MSGRVLGGDLLAKRKILWHEEPDGRIVVETQQDYEDILVENQENRKDRSGFKGKQPLHHVAQIPLTVYEQLMRDGVVEDGRDLRKWLETEEGKIWKTHPGRLA